MRELVLATRNRGKVKELSSLLVPLGVRLLSLDSYPDMPEVVEDGDTFTANAIKKARQVAKFTGLPALADDSGLIVDSLGGQPGVYSARFAGERATDEDNNKKLLKLLAEVEQDSRTARFVSVIALAHPGGSVHTEEGECRGMITDEYRGQGGFGYDPLFLVPEIGKTYAEMTNEEKNRISHRALALKKMQSYLRAQLK